jgi:serine/threonine protein kinase
MDPRFDTLIDEAPRPNRRSAPPEPDDARLDALLERWEEIEEEGGATTPEELCGNCPELLDEFKRRVAALRGIDRKLKTPLNLSEAKTLPLSAEEGAEPESPSGLVVQTTYDDLEFHAKGGLGVVYAAVDQHLRREVAIKFIRSRFAHLTESHNRFLLEAEVTSRLDHPGIVPVYGFGEDDRGRLFYVMRFIHGETLEDAIQHYHQAEGEPRPRGEAALEFRNLLMRFISVCNTIAYAHNRGIVHRDIKPENVMLGRYGETLVVDWGLALPVERDQRARQSGECTLMPSLGNNGDSNGSGAGTPAYMSPEQAGDEASVSPASDIYSLGATLYKILTGQPPIQGKRVGSVLRRVQTGDFAPPRAIDRNISRPLEAVCLKAMAFEPEDRYATATELAQDIERWMADEEVTAYQEPLARKLARWGRRNRTVAQSVVVGLAAVVLVVAGAAVWLGSMAKREAQAHLAADRARQQGLLVSAKFAARTIAGEVDLRWRILETEAADSELKALLAQVNASLDDHALWPQIQAWLDARFIEHNGAAKAESWFINNDSGLQVARSPAGDSIGQNFAHRDYFHGRGFDLPTGQTAGVEPLRQEQLSAVYRSTTTGTWKVAFSTPIWSGRVGSPDRRVLGVLAMSVDLGEFGVLQTDLHGGQTALLIDLREDRLGAQPGRGLVIHHPELQKSAAEDPAAKPLRLQGELVERLLDGARGGSSPGLISSYLDPASPTPRSMLAAFEPVHVKGRPEEIAQTGWAVIVQEAE